MFVLNNTFNKESIEWIESNEIDDDFLITKRTSY